MTQLRPDEIADRLAIVDVLNEYCLRLEVDSFEAWMDLFTKDTVYEVHRMTMTGRAEVAKVLSQAPHGLHLGGAYRITLDGDRAETIQNYAFIADEEAASNTGWYYRTLVRTAEGWKISHTRVQFHKRRLFGAMLPPPPAKSA